MKIRNIVLTFILTIFVVLLFSTTSNASYQRWKELNYDVSLNKDGTMDVTETWNIYVEDTNTLFKEFNKGAVLTNVRVEEVLSNNQTKEFSKIDTYMYHVTKDCYYGLKNKSGNYEIAWGVSIDNGKTKTYKISYTVPNAITTYNDCSELYWQFLSDDNEIEAKKVTGEIKLPENVDNIEDLKVWAHGPLNGEIKKQDEQTVKFSIESLDDETMLEVRVVTTENLFNSNTNIVNSNKLSSILEEETKWANEANDKRDRLIRQEKFEELMTKIISIIFCVLGGICILFILPIWFIYLVVKYKKILKTLKTLEPENKVEYYREIPDEDANPADVGFIYYLNNIDNKIPNIFSAILLDLCLKKCIEFRIQKDKKGKEELVILITENENVEIKNSEKIAYDLLKRLAQENCVTMKRIESYAKTDYRAFLYAMNQITSIAKKEQISKKNYDESNKKNKSKWNNKVAGFIVGLFFMIVFEIIYIALMNLSIFEFISKIVWLLPIFSLAIDVLAIVNAVLCSKISRKYSLLTQKGINEQELWKGLKKYMEDFSIIDEREVPELKIWEKYLVYATVFGIADKVQEQLKIKYPQVVDENYMTNNEYTYMYLVFNNSINRGFMNSLNSSVSRAYSTGVNAKYSAEASSYSSGSGGGGGFSSGGGFRWRWRSLWRKINYNIIGR